jgi:hypothetical protein
MATLTDQIAGISTRLAAAEARIDQTARAVGADALSQYQFRLLLTDDEADTWMEMVEQARGAVAGGTATETQRQQLRSWRDFHLPPGIELSDPATQAGIYALHIWGVLTQARADRVAAGLPPE